MELDDLTEKVGFMKRADYAQKRMIEKYISWKNSYGSELSLVVGKTLETEGVILDVNGENVLFRCPEWDFVG